MSQKISNLSDSEANALVRMAWEDRTPFEAIEKEFSISHGDLISIMRNNLKPSSFKLWRKRVKGRKTKHGAVRNFKVGRHRCDRQGKLG